MMSGSLLLGCLISFLVMPFLACAQHYDRSHISLIFGSGLNPKATIQRYNNTNDATLVTKAAFGFHFGGTYTINPSQRAGLKTGFIMGLRTINYQLNLSAAQYGIPNDVDLKFNSITNATMGIPLLFVYRIPINKRNTLAFDVGGALKFYRSGYFLATVSADTVFNPQDLLLELYIESAVERPVVTFDVILSPQWHLLLKNLRILQIGFQASVSVTKSPYEGQYVLLSKYPARSAGTYNIRNSWFGFELGYVFTRVPNPKRNKDKTNKKNLFHINLD